MTTRLIALQLLLAMVFGGNYQISAENALIEGRRPLEHKDYDLWNSITSRSISPNGQWVMYTVQSGKVDGDATLKIRNIGSAQEYAVLHGAGPRFSFDSRFAIYRITPDKQLVKKLAKDKAKEEEKPVDRLEILELESGAHVTVDRVTSFKLPEENGQWVAFHLHKPVETETVKYQQSDVSETYEVTPQGLRRPVKTIPLKKRKPSTEGLPIEEPSQSTTKQQTEKSEAKEEETEAKSQLATKAEELDDEDDKQKKKPAGTTLVLRNLQSGVERRFSDVVTYTFSKCGDALAFATSLPEDDDNKKKTDGNKGRQDDDKEIVKQDETGDDEQQPIDGVYVFDLKELELKRIISGSGNYDHLLLNDEGSQLALLTDRNDFEAEHPSWDLYLWTTRQQKAQIIAAETTKGIPDGWWVSGTSNSTFSEDGRRLYFSTAPIPETVSEQRSEAKEETDMTDGTKEDNKENEEPKAKLDIWHWQDPLLQPEQLRQAEEERKRSYRAVYDLGRKKVVQLATKDMPFVSVDRRSTANITVANSHHQYRKQLSWNRPGFQDTYFVNLRNGVRELVREKVRSGAIMSPEGNFIIWWDADETKWYAMATGKDRRVIEISAGIDFALQDELHDTPSPPPPYGVAGWTENDQAVLIYDRFDIWQLDPAGQVPPKCVTEGAGRKKRIRFRYTKLDPDQRAVDPKIPIVLSAFDEASKSSGYYRLILDGESENNTQAGKDQSQSNLRKLIMLDESVSGLTRAKNSDTVILTRCTFRKFPDIWSSTLDFKQIHRISRVNAQQNEFTWGTSELVHWKATDGQALDGLLYKPDGFDPETKYPLMVYFYERNSDRLNNYFTPAAGGAIINFSFYVSRGYVVFVPDIPYKTGEPGPSALNSVVPGVQSLIDQGFVDPQRIGMQGHSWGGYQAAYIMTQTDIFACAEAGTPVSNMTSAYGGIRWGSGLSRMFQYERTQSRIGENLWTAREKYIANSPLFFVDRITTPLLILHNDQDGAVPWYQGIELFVAMRRLEKPAWLLNYNEEPHGITKEENRRDFQIRMQQFFDHYLKDAPEPEWMAYGVPAVDKGEQFGLELLEPKSEEPKSTAASAE